ncbi:MAG TPA: ABC transporter ATP-binding protein [Verrucomicrobiae bacterium]|nr:ABC transporter ATP-binding protein [Verrucomicrobiae bacterium]
MLNVRDLTKRFRDTIAVDNLSFNVAAGEAVVLLGPNGAGKTTTFLCMSGLVRPDAGHFEWDGTPLRKNRGQTIGLIPETPEVYPTLTVWEHLVFTARSCELGDDWVDRANELLERFSLAEQRNALGSALSKGMKQKTLIAATVLARTPVLLFDEPMIGIDPAGQRELRDLIAELRAQGTAIAVSTHLLESARAIAERAIILKQGKCLFDGALDSVNASANDLETMFLRITA